MGEEEVYINLLLSLLFNPKKISKQMSGREIPEGRKHMNKKKLFIIASILAAIGLVVMLFMLPKSKTNNSAKPISTETSTSNKNNKKDDKKDNKQSDKKDSKKDDKKEDKKEDTSTTSSETTVTPTTGTNSTETQNNNNSTPSTNTTPTTPAPQPIYQTIHHDEVGHWETQVIAEAWDEPVYERKIIGNNTGTIYNSVSEWGDNANGDEGYHVGNVQVGTTHHDAVTQQVWVVDQAAWDETIIVGYR